MSEYLVIDKDLLKNKAELLQILDRVSEFEGKRIIVKKSGIIVDNKKVSLKRLTDEEVVEKSKFFHKIPSDYHHLEIADHNETISEFDKRIDINDNEIEELQEKIISLEEKNFDYGRSIRNLQNKIFILEYGLTPKVVRNRYEKFLIDLYTKERPFFTVKLDNLVVTIKEKYRYLIEPTKMVLDALQLLGEKIKITED